MIAAKRVEDTVGTICVSVFRFVASSKSILESEWVRYIGSLEPAIGSSIESLGMLFPGDER